MTQGMHLAIVGDGLIGHLLISNLAHFASHLPNQLPPPSRVVWFRGAKPTMAPVSLLHRHVGRTFETDSDREIAWQFAHRTFSHLAASFPHLVRTTTMLRPVSHESRLWRSWCREHPSHVSQLPFDQHPFLSPSDHLLSYSDAFTIDTSSLLHHLDLQAHQDHHDHHIPLDTALRLSHITSLNTQQPLWRLTDLRGRSWDCDHVVFCVGPSSNHWFDGLSIERHAGELAVFDTPPSYNTRFAVSRAGHVAPLLSNTSLCAGATYLHEEDAWPGEGRNTQQGIHESIQGIARWVPSLQNPVNPRLWTGIRAVSGSDRRPIVGKTSSPGIYIATALGSKGMLWGPLVCDLLRSTLFNQPSPHLPSISSDRIRHIHLRQTPHAAA